MKDIKTVLLIFAVFVIIYLLFYFPNEITKRENAYSQLYEIIAPMQMKDEFYSFNFKTNNIMAGMKSPNIS